MYSSDSAAIITVGFEIVPLRPINEGILATAAASAVSRGVAASEPMIASTAEFPLSANENRSRSDAIRAA
ncbi:unannotated protein [freshwater metagenome]|uniref:Unannotated protein n=1 Tax=freshwater metagenome TaxID=449393 RepID=A0A6J7BHC7_9ZZZZ